MIINYSLTTPKSNKIYDYRDESFITEYFYDMSNICRKIMMNNNISGMIKYIDITKRLGGRLFIIGVGGSAGNASHAVNDFRKLCNIETYTPIDNVSELTARTNDDGWENTFCDWLNVSKINARDCLLVLSVGGGNLEKNISTNIVRAVKHANNVGATVLGIVGDNEGYTAKAADHVLVVPEVNKEKRTAYTESMQSVILHCIVNHPILREKLYGTKN